MGGKFELGRIAGLPIFIDISFIATIVLWGQGYFTSGNVNLMSAGFLIVMGVAASTLIHEFAHAVVGHQLGVPPSHIELNGFGGLCYWAGPMTKIASRRIAISVAGPASNYVLYLVLSQLGEVSVVRDNWLVNYVVSFLAIANWYFAVFNMLPAFPLDGGNAAEALLGKFVIPRTARLIVGVLGLCVAVYCAYLAINGNIFMIVIALMLGLENYNAVQGAVNPPWQRRN